MKKIQTCLWFDDQAEQAAQHYAAIFKNTKFVRSVPYGKVSAEISGRPEGSTMTVEFEIEGTSFLGLNGGPVFKMNPSISFFVNCESESEADALWARLAHEPRMPLGEYPFAKKYGWCVDRFGVDWQVIFNPKAPRRQKIVPSLMFVGDRFGKAGEAIEYYVASIPGSEIERVERYPDGKVMFGAFRIAGQDFVAMDGPGEHAFDFTPATSLVLGCDTQEEIDDAWAKLSAVPEAEQCGWLQDKFGVSWQIAHKDWGKIAAEADPVRRERMMSAIFKMTKPDLKTIFSA